MNENPWLRLPIQAPFVLPDDKDDIVAFNKSKGEAHQLRVDELIPEPFVGNPEAPVIILGNNPGYNPDALPRKKEIRFVTRMRANLLHAASDCPFVFFASDVDQDHRQWWEWKFKDLLLHVSHEDLGRSILAVEHFPYPSRRYGVGRLRLKSGARDYSFSLVRKAMDRKAMIVLSRGVRRWLRDLGELENYAGLCRLRNPQTATVSRKNCDRFDEVLRAIELSLKAKPNR